MPHKDPEKRRAYHRERARRMRALHGRDADNERAREHYRQHRDAINARRKEKRSANLESARAQYRDYYSRTREAHAGYRKKYSEQYPDKASIACKRYRQNNPDVAIEHVLRRRARLLGAEGSFSLKQWRFLVALYGGRCLACDQLRPLAKDHVLPLSKGGSNYIHNIQPLCKSCNSRKKDKHIDYRVRLFATGPTIGESWI